MTGLVAWYLAGSNDSSFITYYISAYDDEKEPDGTIHGAYGPRLFSQDWNNQFANIYKLLSQRPSTRQAVIQLFDSRDLICEPKPQDVPCTCCLQFMIRNHQLHMNVSMRSNDAFKGLPHDVFSFTMLQEILARMLACDLGVYSHFAGSLHLYDDNRGDVEKYLAEGWQATIGAEMPPMPLGDPWTSIQKWLDAEGAIRTAADPTSYLEGGLDDYWQDLVRLLQVYKYHKDGNTAAISSLKAQMVSPVYKEYISARERR